ncbi:DUF1772 domain-containing protein [Aspergillus fijiensis CBS 313.89]|uniref:DUF1772-domain-containing protein n=1 Tax=Aspergillus fijiensis CBS 313.89 TaxID=1448319 RepID=A0A8G1RR98_9EURO|nr:uncharacterized protein BO72DRAFT_527615 [Aspergillus fijiensis CBS 313.89]RAK77444.1 hypothetical protein BO72DRAFT_527615 [Aspergillus fijiensis CBS 313.89]
MMPSLSPVTVTGVISSSLAAGTIFTFSFTGVSTAQLAVHESTRLAAQQWVHVHRKSHNLGTPLIVLSEVCFGLVTAQKQSQQLLTAATACMGIVPYTIVALKGPEMVLFAAADSECQARSAYSTRDIQTALARWGTLNLVRTIFPLLGSFLAISIFV